MPKVFTEWSQDEYSLLPHPNYINIAVLDRKIKDTNELKLQ